MMSPDRMHGSSCPKVPHVGSGYEHAEDDDRPYSVEELAMIERASERAAGDFQDQLMQRLGETAEEHGGLIDTLEAQRQAAKQSADVVMRIRRIRDVSDHLPIFRAAVTARELKLKEAHGEIPWRALKIDGERVYIEVVP